MCLFPKLIKNPKYKENKKNGGQLPPVSDSRILGVPIKCGICFECRKAIARDWRIRLREEVTNNNEWKFITLTFNTESLKDLNAETTKKTRYEKDNEIATIAIKRFLERHRKKYKTSIRHWCITELGNGKLEHLHIHGVLKTTLNDEELIKLWKYGYVHTSWNNQPNYVNGKTINYITKYMIKTDESHKYYTPKILCSPGIGKAFLNKEAAKIAKKNDYYINNKGDKMPLPIYYRNNIYTEDERETLWINKLNEDKRYINKQEIKGKNKKDKLKNISAALRAAQKLNKEFGYASPDDGWEEKAYENSVRELIYKNRFKNGSE